jgi:hypothetical protein
MRRRILNSPAKVFQPLTINRIENFAVDPVGSAISHEAE